MIQWFTILLAVSNVDQRRCMQPCHNVSDWPGPALVLHNEPWHRPKMGEDRWKLERYQREVKTCMIWKSEGTCRPNPVDLSSRRGCKDLQGVEPGYLASVSFLTHFIGRFDSFNYCSRELVTSLISSMPCFDSFLCFRKYGGIPEAFSSLRAEQREVPPSERRSDRRDQQWPTVTNGKQQWLADSHI